MCKPFGLGLPRLQRTDPDGDSFVRPVPEPHLRKHPDGTETVIYWARRYAIRVPIAKFFSSVSR